MKITTIVVFILLTSFYLAQSFEGKIVYNNSYTSKIPNVTSEQFSAMMGTTQEYFFKDGQYKSVMNGEYYQWQLYVPSENRLYSKMANSDTLMWSDGSSNTDEVVNYEIQKSQAEILGYQCDAFVVQTKSGKATYYFSSEIKINPELFEDHQYGNWALMTSQTKSLPLKIELVTPQFTLVSTAIEVEEMDLKESFFDLPDAPIKKSPY